jgi:hypothetical protein
LHKKKTCPRGRSEEWIGTSSEAVGLRRSITGIRALSCSFYARLITPSSPLSPSMLNPIVRCVSRHGIIKTASVSFSSTARYPFPKSDKSFFNMADNPDVTKNQPLPHSYLKDSHERLFENNRKWVAAKKEADPKFFDKMAAGQSPDYL